MHPYRIILIILSLVLFYHGYKGMVNGRIYVKGMYADKEKNAFFFWFSVITIYLVAITIFVLATIAKIQ